MGKITAIQYGPYLPVDGGVDEYHDRVKVAGNRSLSEKNLWAEGKTLKIRPSKRRWGPVFTDRFYGLTEYTDSDGNRRVMVASGGAVYEVDESTATVRLSGLATEDLHMQSLRGRLFINGVSTQKKIVGTVSSDVGLDRPGSAPVAAVGGGTGLTGSYAWKVSFVIEEDGVRVLESNLSDVSNSVTLANENATLTVPVSSDARVTARYVYRTSAGGSRYYYEGSIADNTTTSFTSGSVSDATLGDEGETTHGVPVQGTISEGCNERNFWLSGGYLYYSEMAHTEAYLEYQQSTNRKKLVTGGTGKGLKRLYNKGTGREDLFVFEDDAISVLPGGDPTAALLTLVRDVSVQGQDTIAEYKGRLVFLTNKNSVGMLAEGRYIDISARSIPTSLKGLLEQDECRGAVIFDKFYGFTCRSDAGRLYNHEMWVCDLSTVKEVKEGEADAVWRKWEFDGDYMVQRANGDVLLADSRSKQIYRLDRAEIKDEDADGNLTAIPWSRRFANFYGESLFALKQPLQLMVNGTFSRTFWMVPYAWLSSRKTEKAFDPVKSAFVAGASVMGTPTTTFRDQLVAAFPTVTVGNTFSFELYGTADDFRLELSGVQFTYRAFSAGV